MIAAQLDEAGQGWLRGIDDRQRLVVGEVDVVVPHEHRQLPDDFVVAGTTAIGSLGVRPELLLELQHVGVARNGTRIRCVARRRCLRERVVGRRCAAAASR
jgi:hypothetical protein